MKNSLYRYIISAFLLLPAGWAQAQNITTIAGGGDVSGENVPALIGFIKPNAITTDAAGNMYITDREHDVIKKIDASGGLMHTIAGDGTAGFSGDGGAATAARINDPLSITVDASGNIYFVDGGNFRVRKINTAGIISTVAGTGATAYVSDGVPATAAPMGPGAVVADGAGNIVIADGLNDRIRKVNSAGIITTIAGTGTPGFSGDGGPATAARLDAPGAITIMPGGDICFNDFFNYRIRKISASGIITTIAGNGSGVYLPSDDGGPATNTGITAEWLASDGAGNIYATHNNCIRKVSATGIITRIAGQYATIGYNGDGGPATAATFYTAQGVTYDASSGNIFVADKDNKVIRSISTSGTITTVAGNAYERYTGNGGPAQKAVFGCTSLVTDTSGNIYFFDRYNRMMRKIAPDGTISKFAGTGYDDYNGDGGPATSASIGYGIRFVRDKHGSFYMADAVHHVVRKIDAAGIISTIGGTGTAGYNGDGIPATAARFNSPIDIALDTAGNVYFTDYNNRRVRKISTSGIVTTIAGNGTTIMSGDGGPATAAGCNDLWCLTVDKKENILIVDYASVRKISPSGIITRIAGTGTEGYTGDGGPATVAMIARPISIKTDDTGNIYLADWNNYAVRKIDTFGIISTFAGTGIAGFSGDGGLPSLAQIDYTTNTHTDRRGHMYISDDGNHRIRFICTSDTVTSTINIAVSSAVICVGASATFTSSVANTGPLPAYQWKRNGLNIAGATTASYTSSTLDNGDIISCVLWPNNIAPCAENNIIESAGITMTVNAISPTPSISGISQSPPVVSFPGETITYTVTYANGGTAPSFQWYKNGVLIPGANTNPFVTNSVMNGDLIGVTVRTTDPCATPDSTRSVTTTSVSGTSFPNHRIRLYPNPNDGRFVISTYSYPHEGDAIDITNALGMVVHTQQLSDITTAVDLTGAVPPGIYIARIRSAGSVGVFRLILK